MRVQKKDITVLIILEFLATFIALSMQLWLVAVMMFFGAAMSYNALRKFDQR